MTLTGYYGGKANKCFQEKISLLWPESREKEVFCEPFSGSGVLTLNQGKAEWKTEVLNDADIGIATLLRVLADREKGKLLIERLKAFSAFRTNRVWFQALKIESQYFYQRGYDEVDIAFYTYLLLTFSFNCARQSFRAISQEAYERKLENNVERSYKRLQGVTVFCGDALNVIDKYKENPNALLVCDPPYLSLLRSPGARNVYQQEMEILDHMRLLQVLRASSVKAGVILFGYWSGPSGYDLYDGMLLPWGWRRIFVGDVAKSAARTDRDEKKPRGQEYIWTNIELTEIQKEKIGKKNICDSFGSRSQKG